jgi:hypothetical protein
VLRAVGEHFSSGGTDGLHRFVAIERGRVTCTGRADLQSDRTQLLDTIAV